MCGNVKVRVWLLNSLCAEMAQICSKLLVPTPVTCMQYVHPWDRSCANHWVDTLVYAVWASFKTYLTVQGVSMRFSDWLWFCIVPLVFFANYELNFFFKLCRKFCNYCNVMTWVNRKQLKVDFLSLTVEMAFKLLIFRSTYVGIYLRY